MKQFHSQSAQRKITRGRIKIFLLLRRRIFIFVWDLLKYYVIQSRGVRGQRKMNFDYFKDVRARSKL